MNYNQHKKWAREDEKKPFKFKTFNKAIIYDAAINYSYICYFFYLQKKSFFSSFFHLCSFLLMWSGSREFCCCCWIKCSFSLKMWELKKDVIKKWIIGFVDCCFIGKWKWKKIFLILFFDNLLENCFWNIIWQTINGWCSFLCEDDPWVRGSDHCETPDALFCLML